MHILPVHKSILLPTESVRQGVDKVLVHGWRAYLAWLSGF
ncbi:Uncharacterized protein PPKH_4903 [Pseudomonas putida]|nr:Uncharacterized protein PPKH_4903 [Pseudomonas putida]